MASLDDLKAQVAAQTTVVQSIVALVSGISQQLQTAINNLNQAGANTTEIQDISNALQANTQALAAAVTANTPVAPVDTTTTPPAA